MLFYNLGTMMVCLEHVCASTSVGASFDSIFGVLLIYRSLGNMCISSLFGVDLDMVVVVVSGVGACFVLVVLLVDVII